MSLIRSEAVIMAKIDGTCTSCFKNKAKEHHYQCDRCIETNALKRRRNPEKYLEHGRKSEQRRYEMSKFKKKSQRTPEEEREYQRVKKAKSRADASGHLSDEHKLKISVAMKKSNALKAGRKEAFAKEDKVVPKRKYKTASWISPVRMMGMVNELELFISNLPDMSASAYIEGRENLIKSILKRGE